MKIEEISVRGFGKFKEKEKWRVKEGLLIVEGRNGSGKSTLYVESLGWCLYGDTYKGVRADDVVNDESNVAEVIIRSDIGEIRRVKERGKGSVVYLNGSVVSDNELVRIIGMGRDLFFNSVVFGSGMSGFVQVSGSERKALMEVCLVDVGVYMDRIMEIEKRCIGEKGGYEREIGFIDNMIEDLEGEVKGYESYKKEEQEIKEEIRSLKSRIREFESKSREDEQEIKEVEKEGEQIRRNIEVKRKEIEERKVAYGKVRGELDKYEEEMGRFRGLGDRCFVCKQKIGEEYKRKIVGEYQVKIDESRRKMEKVKKEIEAKEREIEGFKREWEKCQRKRRKLYELVSGYREEISRLEKGLRGLEGRLVKLEEIDRVYEKLEELRMKRKEVERVIKERERKVEDLEFWRRKFAEYRTGVAEEVMVRFEGVANKYLLGISNGRFSMEFSAGVRGKKRIRESYDVIVKDGGKVVDYSRLSNGERRLVTLGVNMGFRHVMSNFYAGDWNIVVFDEVFDGLDRRVRERVVDMMLEMVKETGKSVVVITHEDFDYRVGEWEKRVII